MINEIFLGNWTGITASPRTSSDITHQKLQGALDARMKIRQLPETFPSKEKEKDAISALFDPIFSLEFSRWSHGETRFAKYTLALRSAQETSASGGGRERNGMNVRSNDSWGSAYGDNLFAVIRMAKEMIWRPPAYLVYPRSRISTLLKLRNTFCLPRPDSGTVKYTYVNASSKSRQRRKFLHPCATDIPFFRIIFVSSMRLTGRKLFAEIGTLFIAFVGCRWLLWDQHSLVLICISTFALREFINLFYQKFPRYKNILLAFSLWKLREIFLLKMFKDIFSNGINF